MAALLIAILLLSSLVLTGMGFRRWRRRGRLTRLAHQCGLRFSARDTFGLAQRYQGCYLMQSGHSAHAANVLFGQFGAWRLRLFDYHFEVGHGPRRVARRFSVVAADIPEAGAGAFCWRDGPAGTLGLPLSGAELSPDRWWRAGDRTLGRRITDCWPGGELESVGIEVVNSTVLFATADRLRSDALHRYLQVATDCLTELANVFRADG